jgi:hypothetical protein
MMMLGGTQTSVGNYKEELDTLARIEPYLAAMSPVNQSTLKLFQAYGLVGTGELQKGILRFEEAAGGQDSMTDIGAECSDFALILAGRGANAEAEAYANRSLDIFAHNQPREYQRAGATAARALCKARQGDAKGALADADTALAFKSSHNAIYFVPRLARGEALLLLHREAEGLADLEWAMKFGDENRGDRGTRADARFQVARGLIATHGDRERAVALAKRAADDFDKEGMPDAANRVRDWIASGAKTPG